MTPSQPAPDLRVAVDTPVGAGIDPFLLPPAIRTMLRRGDWPCGPERLVAEAVVRAVEAAAREQRSSWH
jgi:hypothetical protein